MTAPEKLTVEQVGQDRRTVKALWVAHGGEQHGPIVEHYSIEEQAFYRFVDALLARHRQQAEARAEGLVAALEKIASCEKRFDGDVVDTAAKALTAYRSVRP